MARVRDAVLAFALSLPGTAEDHPWGEDVVKVNGKIFVFLGGSGRLRMTVKLDEAHGHACRSTARPARATASEHPAG